MMMLMEQTWLTFFVRCCGWNRLTGCLQANCLVTNGLTHECWFGVWASDLLLSFINYDDQLLILQVMALVYTYQCPSISAAIIGRFWVELGSVMNSMRWDWWRWQSLESNIEERRCNQLGMIDPKGTFGLLYFGSQVLPQIIKSNAGLGSSYEAHLTMKIHHHWECFFCVPQYNDVTSRVASHVFAFLVNKVLSRLCKKDVKYDGKIWPFLWHDLTLNIAWRIIWQMIVLHETVHLQLFMWKEAKGNLPSFWNDIENN